MSEQAAEIRAWYREPFVWMVISFPLAAVIAGTITIYLAIVSFDGLVVDDYYQRGLEINKVLDRENFALANGLSLNVEYQSDKFIIEISHTAQFALPDSLTAIISHATKPGYDQTIVLTRFDENRFHAAPVDIPIGRWYVDVGTAEWRLNSYLITP